MRRFAMLVIFVASLFWVLPVHAQGGTPPPTPTAPPNLLQTCADDGLGKCVVQAMEQGGWIVLILAIVFIAALLILRVYGQALGEVLKKVFQKDMDTVVQNIEINDITRAYLEKVSKTYTRFKFRGLPRHVAKNDANRLSLDQAYISVRVLAESPERGQMEKGKRGAAEMGETLGRMEKSEPVELTEVLQKAENRHLAVIGIAGSGKSTLLQWAGLACARARLGEKLNAEQQEFIHALGGKVPLPVFIPLRAYNEHCKQKDVARSAKSLLEFMACYFSENQTDCEFTLDFFKKNLHEACLLMFDGVDEVEPADRPGVRAAVESLLADFDHPRLFCLITSRPSASYVSDQMAGFRRCEVQRLTPAQRNDLVTFWHKAVYLDNPFDGEKKAVSLIQRIENASEKVRDLATTPLMVTIFCMVSYSHDLPRLRAQLYEDAIEVLLTDTVHHDGDYSKGLADWGGMDWGTRCYYLAFIAFKMQEKAAISMLEADLVKLIWPKFGAEREAAEKSASQFLRIIAERGGLLEAMDVEYGFYTHATFQEYLSGRFLAGEMKAQEQEKFLLEHFANDQWQESIRLAAGYLSLRGKGLADDFVNLLAGLGQTPEERAKALALAGECLVDMLADRREPETVKMLAADLCASLTAANLPQTLARLRLRLGLALGALGDPRLKPLEPALVPVPASLFQIGTSPEDEKQLKAQNTSVYDDEKPAHEVYVSAFEIGKYPVTNAEFRLFWEQKGYEQQEFWSEDGWKWRSGKWDSDLSYISDESVRKNVSEWLARRPVELRSQPFFWDDPQWNAPNLPVVGLCWFEAEAYCKWLSILTQKDYRLPTEAEWEKAARFAPLLKGEGLGVRLWPWGNTWNADLCDNSDEDVKDKLGRTSPVGMYPGGISPCGALDMIGNVWEWCADWHAEDTYRQRAVQPVKDPSGPSSGSARVLRGGAWFYGRHSARCAYRGRYAPDYFYSSVGFRVVCSPITL